MNNKSTSCSGRIVRNLVEFFEFFVLSFKFFSKYILTSLDVIWNASKDRKNIDNTNHNLKKKSWYWLNAKWFARYKFTDFQETINGNVGCCIHRGKKIVATFPSSQFVSEGNHSPYRSKLYSKIGGILAYVKS